MTTAQIPHFSFPFRLGETGSVAVVEQDSFEEVEQNVVVLALTEIGERLEVPGFGVPDPTFATNIDTRAIVEAAQEWDERVDALVEEEEDARQMIRRLRVQIGEEQ